MRTILATSLIACFTVVAPTFADSLGFAAPASGIATGVGPNDPVNLGLVFTLSTNITVDDLGFWNEGGMAAGQTVGLYNSSGTLLASAVVTLTDPLVGGYFMHSITPIALQSGQTYTVDTYVGNDSWAYGPAPTGASGITFVRDSYIYTNSLAYPTSINGSGPNYYGADFEIASAPEPASWALLATLVLAFALLRRRLRAI